MALAPHGIEAAWRYLQAVVETHGWRILGLSVLFFLARQRYSAYATRAHAQRTLREANDPERVAVLRREAARVREEQQQCLQETLKHKRRKSKSKPL